MLVTRVRCVRVCGFTLVELMVTLAVFSIMVGLALPSFQTFMAENRAKARAVDLAAAVKTAQSEAFRRNREVVFTLTQSPKPTAALEGISGTANAQKLGWVSAALRLAGSGVALPFEVIDIGGSLETSADVLIQTSSPAVCILPNGSLKANVATGIPNVACAAASAAFIIKPSQGKKRWQVMISEIGNISTCLGTEDSLGAFTCS